MSIYDKASLVLIPSGTKTSKVYSQKPVNGDGDFTFSRSTAATRVNADGNIEKETQNLFTYSNTFSNSAWNKNAGGSFTSGQAGYDGSNDAWQFNVTTASNSGTWQNVTFSGVATFSAYFKKGTIDKVGFTNYAGNAYECWFDLTNGTIGQQTGDLIDANIESVGGGWYRCSITDIAVSTNYFQLKPSNAYSGVSTAGYIYIQDAQLEQGLVARDYIETTTAAVEGGITDNVPRLDYTDSSCPALLLEPQRTNLVTHSEYLGGYTTTGTGTATQNAETSPEGYDNAFKLDDTSNTAYYKLETNVTLTAGNHTLSVFIKKTTGVLSHYAGLQLDASRKYIIIDTTNGTYNEVTGTDNDSIVIEDFSDDYWRVIVTNNTTSGSKRVAIWPSISGNGTSLSASATGSNIFYGLQLEEGSYATSYIPTYGSAVTRNADNPTLGNLQSNNIAGDTFSYFFEWGDYVADRNFEMKDSSNTNFLFMVSRLFRYNTESGGVDSLMILPTNGTSIKCMVTYDGTTLKGFVNGALEGSVTDAKASQFSDLNYLRLDRDNPDSEELRSLMIFPTALTDQEAIDLTTL